MKLIGQMAVSLIQYFKLILGLISTLTSVFGLKSWVLLSVEKYWQTFSFPRDFWGTCYGTFFGTVIEIQHISHARSLFFIWKVKAMFSNPNVKGKEATLSKTAPGKYKQQV